MMQGIMQCAVAVLVLCVGSGLAALPLPTPGQLNYHQHEIMALIHFNMATFVKDGDPGCGPANWNTGIGCSDPKTFNPVGLNVSNWIESFHALGAKHGVLTAKHGCGFLTWNTSSVLPDGRPYPYAVGRGDAFDRDVIAEFSSAMEAAGLGHGYYYSTGNNYFLNRRGFDTIGKLLPGMANVTDEQYYDLVLVHLEEIWSRFSNLTEVWFDHGYGDALKTRVQALLQKYQAGTAGFNGYGIMPSPVKWCGTESGSPAYPIWSTGCNPGTGDPNSPDWCPTGVDTTLQNGDHWFFTPGDTIRTLAELIPIYHTSVGQNGVLEMDFAINRDGVVEPSHAQRYKEFGDWIRSCYGTPVASTSGSGSVLNVTVPAGKTVDRIVIQEDQSQGQRVRVYEVYTQSSGGSWVSWMSGTSIGNKRIQLGSSSVSGPATIQLRVTSSVATPAITNFAAHAPCPTQ